MVNLDILARELARHHIQDDVDNGISEDYLRRSHHASGWGWKFLENNPHSSLKRFGSAHVQIGGYVKENGNWKSMPGHIIVVRLMGQDIYKAFSLHDIYQECKKGQLTLL